MSKHYHPIEQIDLENITNILTSLRNLMEQTRAEIDSLKRNQEHYAILFNNIDARLRKVEK